MINRTNLTDYKRDTAIAMGQVLPDEPGASLQPDPAVPPEAMVVAPPTPAGPPAPEMPPPVQPMMPQGFGGANIGALDAQGRKIAQAGQDSVKQAEETGALLEGAALDKKFGLQHQVGIQRQRAAANAASADDEINQRLQYQAKANEIKKSEDEAVLHATDDYLEAVDDAKYAGVSTERRRELMGIINNKDATPAQKASAKAELDKAQNIDPNRFFGESTGAKITAAIAMALGAYASSMGGGPNTAMQIIQGAIADNIDAQKQNFAKKRAEAADAKGRIEETKKTYEDQRMDALKQMGIGLEMAKLKLQKVSAGLDGTEAGAKAKIMGAEIDGELAKNQEAIKQAAIQNHQQSLVQQGGLMANAAQLREQRADRAAAARGGPGLKDLPAGEAKALGELEASEPMLDNLLKEFREKTGPGDVLPGASVLSKSTRQYNDKRSATAQLVGGIMEGGKLTEDDFAKYRDLLPDASDSYERAQSKIANLKTMLKTKREAAVKSFGGAGYNVGGLVRQPTAAQQGVPGEVVNN